MKTQSISDDDLCSTCVHCVYQPGELSECVRAFPGSKDADGYIAACADYLEQEYMGQNLPPVIWLRQFQGTAA